MKWEIAEKTFVKVCIYTFVYFAHLGMLELTSYNNIQTMINLGQAI